MAATLRARSLRHLRIRGRNDSGEENVSLDLSRDPCDNMREILQNVAKLQGVSNMRKLGHLNNFTKWLKVKAWSLARWFYFLFALCSSTMSWYSLSSSFVRQECE